jgi:Cu(I)/Ag(I) efflux system membrane fusion protein
MRVFAILLLLLVCAAPVMAADHDGRKILYWYDPMVPGQKFDKPGKSPYMDMALVPFYADQAGGGDDNIIPVDASYRQALGVKTAPARMQDFGKAIEAFGTIVPETRLEYIVAVRTGGWIIDLKADAVGDAVKKGDLLFTFYSQDLMAAQSDYMTGGRRVGNAEQRLRLYGMDDKAIADLKARGRFMEQTPFYAPADGVVTALNVRKGAYIDPQASGNATVLTIQDFSQLWITASVPVKDLRFLSAGTLATVTVDETGQTFKAAIDTIFPMTDPQSHDGTARLVVDNPDGKLKTGSIVNLVFDAGSQPRLAVPVEAVLYGKDGGHVIEDIGKGAFRPVKVETGITARGLTEIVSGLTAGQSIVTSGQFMIDAESNLRGGLSGMDSAMDKGGDHAH